MDSKELKNRLFTWTLQHSGAEHRTYLGMSGIGLCSRVLYNQMLQGREWTTRDHLNCYLGYLFERDILARLAALNPGDLLKPGREFSDFGGRFMGHSDGELDGQLLEIKSVLQTKLDYIQSAGRIPNQHYNQVQCYMHYGDYSQATVIYVARDTGEMYVTSIRRSIHVGETLRLKAATILEAVDARIPPDCDCGRCESRSTRLQGPGVRALNY